MQGHTNILTLNRLERIRHAIGGARVGVITRDKGHLLAHRNEGLLIIQRQQTGCGQNIRIALFLQRIKDRGHREVIINHAPPQGRARNL